MANLLRTATFWRAGAVVYLAIPYFLFLFGWLELPLALILGALLAFGGWLTVRDLHRGAATDAAFASPLTYTNLAAVTLLAVGLVALSGIGGFGFQHYDWNKHNAILSDLVRESWPVGYTSYGRPVALVYYIAYYLPAALAGKLWGWPAANLALALWSVAGLILVLVLFLQAVNRRRVWLVLFVFTLFSGLDVVGSPVTHSPLSVLWPEREFPAVWSYWLNHDGWSAWQYSSNVKLLFTVPNQALAGWLITALIVLPLLAAKRSHSTLFLWGLSALWSPFITIGLAPLLLVDLLPGKNGESADWRRLLSAQNLIGLLLLGVAALFYAAKLAPLSPLRETGFRAGFYLALVAGWLPRLHYLWLLLLFYLLEFGLFGWLIACAGVLRRTVDRQLFWAATGWLLVLPLWVFGAVNDLVMRASIPALWLYTLFLAQTVADADAQTRLRRWLLGGALLIAALNPLQDLLLHTRQLAARGTMQALPPADESILAQFADAPNRLVQYLGSRQTPFFEWLGKPPAARTDAPAPLLFGDRLVITDHTLAATQLAPGAQTELALTLESWQSIPTEYALATRLIDASGQVIWEEQGWPSGRNTTTWTPFHPYSDVRTVQIPPAAAPGTLVLQAYFTDPATFAKLPAARLPDAVPLGEVVTLEYVTVGDAPASLTTTVPALADFGDEFSLTELVLPEQTNLAPGATVPITLTWQAQRPLTQAYVQTLQLLDGAGRLVAQQDGQLFGGALPTTQWQPDRAIHDATAFVLPPDLAPGRYTVIVAWYAPESGARLPVVDPAGDAPGAEFVIAEIDVETP